MSLAKLRRFSRWLPCRNFSQSVSRYPFGIAFDIDGVLLRGGQPIKGASEAMSHLYQDRKNPNQARIPFIFLTNGGGIPEFSKALELSELLGVKILAEQVFLGHTPFKSLIDRYGNSHVLAVGKGNAGMVMTNYGFRSVVQMEEYVLHFKDIDPLAKYKHWSTGVRGERTMVCDSLSRPKPVDAVFIVSDPVDWGRDIQVLCDVLRSGGCPGRLHGNQPPLFFAADDLEYQAAFPVQRLGMGAFRIALQNIYNRISESPLVYTSFGKPNAAVFRGAEAELLKIAEMLQATSSSRQETQVTQAGFEKLYMIGDNPMTDILGVKQAGQPWVSILTRTGCFKGKGNDDLHPADLVVDNVEDAVHSILQQHGVAV